MTKIGILVGSLRKESFSKKIEPMLRLYSLKDMKVNLSKSKIYLSIIKIMIMKTMFGQNILLSVTE